MYGIPYLFTDYNDLLALEDIDFVSICLPNYLHEPVTVQALKSNKHVHCEKPMAMNEKQAKTMYDTQKETGKQLMIGLNNRFMPSTMFAKKFVEEGHPGEIYYAKCGWLRRRGLPASEWFQNIALSGGGPLVDLGVHYIDLVMYLLDYPNPTAVTARTYRKFGGTDVSPLYAYQGAQAKWLYNVEDLVSGFLELENDISVLFEISWASNVEKEEVFYELYGTKANIRYSNGELKIFTAASGQFADIIPQIEPSLYKDTEFTHFINCIKSNSMPSIVKTEQCVKMMKIIDAMYYSAEEKRQIRFN